MDLSPTILQGQGLRKTFGGLVAVNDVSVAVGKGEIVGLIGPNGSGKTTLLDLLSGVQPADAGRVMLEDRDLSETSVSGRAQAGISRLFQHGRPFKSLTVGESVRVALRQDRGGGHLIQSLIETVGLVGHQNRLAGQLSYGQQRLLDFARALATTPSVLLLDEPTAGVHSIVMARMAELVQRLARDTGIGVLVVEHNVEFVEKTCHRVVAMAEGCVIASGSPRDVLGDANVVAAYFGE
jgi:ABC-type branched-subunit amino acid transport system ATPase component